MKRIRPTQVDFFLSEHPSHREIAEGWAADIGITLDQLLEKLTAIGCQTSRSGAARWRLRFRSYRPGIMSNLRQRVVNAALVAPDQVIAEAAKLFKIT